MDYPLTTSKIPAATMILLRIQKKAVRAKARNPKPAKAKKLDANPTPMTFPLRAATARIAGRYSLNTPSLLPRNSTLRNLTWQKA
jgi:hypothetical protein